jgi:hypothetical protein
MKLIHCMNLAWLTSNFLTACCNIRSALLMTKYAVPHLRFIISAGSEGAVTAEPAGNGTSP